MASRIEEQVEEIALQVLQTDDKIELVDVEYVKERDWYLRVYINKPGGVGLDDCQSVSEKLEEVLDEKDVVPDNYILEVSSPGLDRVLKKPRDFERELGKKVDVALFAPLAETNEKTLVGILRSYDGAGIVLDEDRAISFKQIAQVRLHIDI